MSGHPVTDLSPNSFLCSLPTAALGHMHKPSRFHTIAPLQGKRLSHHFRALFSHPFSCSPLLPRYLLHSSPFPSPPQHFPFIIPTLPKPGSPPSSDQRPLPYFKHFPSLLPTLHKFSTSPSLQSFFRPFLFSSRPLTSPRPPDPPLPTLCPTPPITNFLPSSLPLPPILIFSTSFLTPHTRPLHLPPSTTSLRPHAFSFPRPPLFHPSLGSSYPFPINSPPLSLISLFPRQAPSLCFLLSSHPSHHLDFREHSFPLRHHSLFN